MFKESCRAFLYYSQSQDDIPPEHDECGPECIDCPRQTERESFEEALTDTLTEKTGEKWKDYGLNSLLQTVIDISEIENTESSNWTITTDRLVKILRSERNRLERIDRWNSRKPEN